MDITPANVQRARSRSRSRTRNSTSRSSSVRRPSLASKRSLSSSSLTKLNVTPTTLIDGDLVVPSVQASLDNSLPVDFFKQDIWGLVKALKISKWHKKPLDFKKINIIRISGALTNSIYKIEYKDDKIKIPSLLLRIYGKNVDEIIDRDSELEVLIKLSSKKIGPKLLGIFANGRFEQFLEGFNTLNRFQIRDEVISQMLARRMKDLHHKIVLDYKDYKDNLPTCWKLINKWLNTLEKNEILQNFRTHGIQDEDLFLMKYDSFKQKIFAYRDWLFDHYHTNGFASNFKFCHNDTQYGNLLLHESFKVDDIIIDQQVAVKSNVAEGNLNQLSTIKSTSNKKDGNLVVIDFEYGGANFPAFDLANHFCEWMANYHDEEKSYYLDEHKFPNKLEQLNLIKAYIEYDFQYPSSNLKTSSTPDLNQITPTELIQFEIRKMYNECIYWRTTVQIYWCIWGLIQNGPITKKDGLIGETSHEIGVDSTYTITTGLNNLELHENAVVEDEISSNDDEFDYLKFAQQKSALAIGDMIRLGVISKQDVDKDYLDQVKYLDCEVFDL